VEKAVKIIEDTASKLQLQDKPTSYAQAARTEGTRAAPGVALDAPQKIHPKEEKHVMIKIPNKTEAEVIRDRRENPTVRRREGCESHGTRGTAVEEW
jgi:hypothetical protein